jgi:hypothetical protein
MCAWRTSGSHVDSAGGIRTHDLELMRLAGTAAPLPRKSGWLESNQRSPAPKAGGVASLPYSQVSIESTTVESNHAVPPYQSGACPAGPSSVVCPRLDPRLRRGTERHESAARRGPRMRDAFRGVPRRRRGIRAAGIRSADSGSRTRLRRSLAGRSRTPVHHGRNMALSTELRRERRSRRESNPPHPGDSQAASPDAHES